MKNLLAMAPVGIALALSLVALSGCGVDPSKAERALRSQGLKDVRIGGYSVFGCGRDDDFSSTFTATGADGQPVSGVVCGGACKGVTVRYD